MTDDSKEIPVVPLSAHGGARRQRLRMASRQVNSDDPLVLFLYQLMRDHVSAGVVSSILDEVDIASGEQQYTNGFLAEFATIAAKEIRRRPNLVDRGHDDEVAVTDG